jgi:hypothetical protein
VEEVAILSPCHDPLARQRSYRLLAEACGLGADSPRETPLAVAAE